MNRSVMIVDDDPDTLYVYSNLFKAEGYRVTTASNGQECLDALAVEKPDLILLDVMLPDMLGSDLCYQIKQSTFYRNILIVLITGRKVSEQDQIFGLDIGADDYLSRPLVKEKLLARINSLFRLKEAFVSERIVPAFQQFNDSASKLTSDIYEQYSLKMDYPHVFEKFMSDYTRILNAAIEHRVYKKSTELQTDIKRLAFRIAEYRASARDVIEIHQETLKSTKPETARQSYYLKEEGRILLIELLGYLLNFYGSITNRVGKYPQIY